MRPLLVIDAVRASAVAGTVIRGANEPGIVAMTHFPRVLPWDDPARVMDVMERHHRRRRQMISAGHHITRDRGNGWEVRWLRPRRIEANRRRAAPREHNVMAERVIAARMTQRRGD